MQDIHRDSPYRLNETTAFMSRQKLPLASAIRLAALCDAQERKELYASKYLHVKE
jgi:hypothetical protein